MKPVGGTPRIDAHHHLWRYTDDEFGWIGDDLAVLRRNFLLDDLRTAIHSAGVDGTVAVQARQSLEETRWLLSLTTGNTPIQGVVGWLSLADPNFASVLESFLPHSSLKGLRHVVQAEPELFLDGGDFNRGMRVLQTSGLTYDLLLLPHQLKDAVRFVDRYPAQTFVLDHIAKPAIRAGELEPWATDLRELARRPNVSCKISGMVTEADPAHWTVTQLTPYFEVVLEAFRPERLMIGTDWPVLTAACDYATWWRTVETWITPLSLNEQAQILGGTATRVYQLQPASLAA